MGNAFKIPEELRASSHGPLLEHLVQDKDKELFLAVRTAIDGIWLISGRRVHTKQAVRLLLGIAGLFFLFSRLLEVTDAFSPCGSE